jgi:cell division protein ZapA
MVALELAFEKISLKDKNDTEPYKEKIRELTEELESILKGKIS